ncbi:MAG TPA: hypothetical protein VMW79_07910 [Anaerolineae bacterium]|nr:hypothetical protein [Anaerolineae bacterium]
MGGKNSSGSSTTQSVIPPWLKGIMEPLLGGSATKLQEFQNQGWDVLQGNQPQQGVSLEELASRQVTAGGSQMPPNKAIPKTPEAYGGM